MSRYAFRQRTFHKRSLSRRKKIILASLLVPASFIAIGSAPVGAAPNSNPIFATLHDVQNAINIALAPIQSAISSLQTTQATQAQQISNLQNAPSKALHVYDANAQDLGILVDRSGAATEVYSTSLQRFIHLYFGSASIDGDFDPGTVNGAYYPSTDCTGTPYTLKLFADPSSYTSDLIPIDPQTFAIIPDHEAANTVSLGSVQTWDTGGHDMVCHFDSLPNAQAYQLQTVNLPFTLPLAQPLQFKYQ